jgi:ABC-type multidrug transport system fused ATPase/permease subunit
MGFILEGLGSEPYDRYYGDRELVHRILSHFRPHVRLMILVAAMIALSSIVGTGGPILISMGLDMLVADPAIELMLLVTGGMLVLGVSNWAFGYLRRWFSARVVGDVVLDLRRAVFDATVRHDLSFYDQHPSGKVVSRVTSDTQGFARAVTLTMELISQVLLIVIFTAWLFNVNARLTLLLLLLVPIVVLIALSFRRIARKVTQQARRATAAINAEIQESISGIMVAKSFRQERAVYRRFEDNNQREYRVRLQQGLVFNTIFPVMDLTAHLGLAALAYVAGLTTRGGTVSAGEWYLFMQGVQRFLWPLMSIASFWSQFQDGLSAAERVFALIDAAPKVVQTADEPVERLEGRIEFRHLAFSYVDGEDVLPDLSLDIRPAETVALVGHTGAGKSSIARLIARFYEFQGGQLLIDGRDVRRLNLGQYRRHLGLVPQEPFLFSGSVRDNVRYGRQEATDEQVRQAAERICGGDWLADLPHGLDTEVGERGGNLSMGQRQLVALARVLLVDPAIFVLDEATASVDPFTETQIQEGLETVMRDRTAIVIAHRLSTVVHADRIVVLDHGRIIEEGTHDELLAEGGHYAELYNTYFRHQSLDYRPWEMEETVRLSLAVNSVEAESVHGGVSD